MKLLLATLLLLVGFAATAAAQDDPNWPSLSYLRQDYKSSKLVARVNVRTAEIVSRIPGYEDWRLVAEVLEPFKGALRKGQEIIFYHGADAGFKKDLFLGDKLIFLIRNYHEQDKQWVYAVIENSTLPSNEDRVSKLRRIGRTRKRNRR